LRSSPFLPPTPSHIVLMKESVSSFPRRVPWINPRHPFPHFLGLPATIWKVISRLRYEITGFSPLHSLTPTLSKLEADDGLPPPLCCSVVESTRRRQVWREGLFLLCFAPPATCLEVPINTSVIVMARAPQEESFNPFSPPLPLRNCP